MRVVRVFRAREQIGHKSVAEIIGQWVCLNPRSKCPGVWRFAQAPGTGAGTGARDRVTAGFGKAQGSR